MSAQTSSEPPMSLFEQRLEYRVNSVFGPLCAAIPPGQIAKLKDQVRLHVDRVRQALRHNEFLDLKTAEQIVGILLKLLDEYEDYPQEQQALIVGAACYFAQMDDADPDTASVLGFDDDVTVLNYVLDQIGLSEQRLEL